MVANPSPLTKPKPTTRVVVYNLATKESQTLSVYQMSTEDVLAKIVTALDRKSK